MSSANVKGEACPESSPVPRPSNVRKLIQMFEQLTVYGGQTAPPPVLRADPPHQAPRAVKTLTLLVNGRRVAQTRHESVQQTRAGLDASP
ncbi:hypothetical protein AWZ03_011527 [Drosophila navojoa]|uniref:Uncharacterized protein n=1 Tax=Drosophila navojoa TaxID=7232 RepID=A0A484B032_DRONA|nr:hypothetical protein AWZ03_011527 [Drosophila navojoa]